MAHASRRDSGMKVDVPRSDRRLSSMDLEQVGIHPYPQESAEVEGDREAQGMPSPTDNRMSSLYLVENQGN